MQQQQREREREKSEGINALMNLRKLALPAGDCALPAVPGGPKKLYGSAPFPSPPLPLPPAVAPLLFILRRVYLSPPPAFYILCHKYDERASGDARVLFP